MTRSVRGYFFASLAFFILLEVMLAAAILYWPNFEENIAELKMIAPLPILREMIDQLAEEGVSAYVNSQHFFKGCNTLGVAAAVLFAMNAVAGEANRGTLELVLSRPFSRTRLLLEKYALGAAATTVPVFLTSLTVPFLLEFVEQEMELSHLMLAALHQSAFLMVVYSLAFYFSCRSSRPVMIAFILLFVTTFEFAIYLVKGLTKFSIFVLVDLDDYSRIVKESALDLPIFLPLCAGSALLLYLSLRAFRKRTP